MIRHCSMHNINLGILGVSNGSCLPLDSNQLQFKPSNPTCYRLPTLTSNSIHVKMFEASSSFVGILWWLWSPFTRSLGDRLQGLQGMVSPKPCPRNSAFVYGKFCNLDFNQLAVLRDAFMTNMFLFLIWWILELCSPSKVWKGTNLGAHLTAKAFNARVVCSWLSSCLEMALREAVEPGRLCGRWIVESGADWPQHELLLPSAVAMTLRLIS